MQALKWHSSQPLEYLGRHCVPPDPVLAGFCRFFGLLMVQEGMLRTSMRMCVCTRDYMCVYVFVCMHVCIRMHVYVRACMSCVYACACVRMCVLGVTVVISPTLLSSLHSHERGLHIPGPGPVPHPPAHHVPLLSTSLPPLEQDRLPLQFLKHWHW